MYKTIVMAFLIVYIKLHKLFGSKTIIFFSIICVVSTYKYSLEGPKFTYYTLNKNEKKKMMEGLAYHRYIVQKFFEPRKKWVTSNLGAILFKNKKYSSFSTKNKTFLVLVWKDWETMKEQHVYYFGANDDDTEILKDCSVTNCEFTGDSGTLKSADVVLVRTMEGLLPVVKRRNEDQIWVFLNDESPLNAFITSKRKPKLKKWANIFNWSMTYRSDSDVPVPYGRTVPLERPIFYAITHDSIYSILSLIPHYRYKRLDVLVTVVISHCGVDFRMKFLEELQKYIKIDVYGACSKVRANRGACPGHFRRDCHLMNNYYFYLVIENSMCRQYLTEKIFHNAYSKGAIPIIVGPNLHDSKMLLPPHSYIHYDNYLSPKDLAEKIRKTYLNLYDYLSYHLWRNHFQVLNEHGLFQGKSYHYCRLCEALNYNKKEKKIYDLDELQLFLNPKLLCRNKLFIIRD